MVALAAAVGIVAFGVLSAPSQAKPVSKLPSPSKPLFKPEPGMILRNRSLGLSPSQGASIEAIDHGWQRDRAALLDALGSYRPEKAMTGGLEGYSELSRRFDAGRQAAWDRALATLTPAQRLKLP